MNPQAAEYGVQRNYVETILELPWEEYTKDNFNLRRVHKILDQDHYGLEKIKERIIEHLAVLKLKDNIAPDYLFTWTSRCWENISWEIYCRCIKSKVYSCFFRGYARSVGD